MLDFVNHYYEVTEENIDQLRQMIIVENIQRYDGSKFKPEDVQIGRVLGNVWFSKNPTCTGYWQSKATVPIDGLEKVTTELPNTLMTIE